MPLTTHSNQRGVCNSEAFNLTRWYVFHIACEPISLASIPIHILPEHTHSTHIKQAKNLLWTLEAFEEEIVLTTEIVVIHNTSRSSQIAHEDHWVDRCGKKYRLEATLLYDDIWMHDFCLVEGIRFVNKFRRLLGLPLCDELRFRDSDDWLAAYREAKQNLHK